MDEEIKDLTAFEVWNVLVRIILSELPNPPQIGFKSALPLTIKLDETGEFLIPLSRSDDVMFFLA